MFVLLSSIFLFGKLSVLMRKVKFMVIALLLLGLVVGIIFFLLGYLKPTVGGIYIESVPSSSVFINSERVGKTPYKDTLEPGEVVVKLVSDSFEAPLAPYETKVTLVSGVETVIRRDFGETQEVSGGEIISFEKIDKNETGIAIITLPDAAQLFIDQETKAFSPYKSSTITPGIHQIKVSANGFKDKNIEVKAHQGYKLTAIVELVPEINIDAEEEVEKEEEKVEKVKIIQTPVGFLRVRSEPSTLGREVSRVEPGQVFPFLEEDTKTGWYKIEYEEGQEGWISNKYAEITKESEENLEDEETASVSATPTQAVIN